MLCVLHYAARHCGPFLCTCVAMCSTKDKNTNQFTLIQLTECLFLKCFTFSRSSDAQRVLYVKHTYYENCKSPSMNILRI